MYLSTNTLNPYMELNERFLFNVLIHIFHATIFPLISPFALRVQRRIREPLFTVVFWALQTCSKLNVRVALPTNAAEQLP